MEPNDGWSIPRETKVLACFDVAGGLILAILETYIKIAVFSGVGKVSHTYILTVGSSRGRASGKLWGFTLLRCHRKFDLSYSLGPSFGTNVAEFLCQIVQKVSPVCCTLSEGQLALKFVWGKTLLDSLLLAKSLWYWEHARISKP